MATRRFEIEVTQTVEVELDPAAFTEQFLSEFRESFYPFYTLADHAEHIAQLQARGIIDLEVTPEFVEGYGPSEEMGLKAKVASTFIEQVSA